MNRYKAAMEQLYFPEDVADKIYLSVMSKATSTKRKIKYRPAIYALIGSMAVITVYLTSIDSPSLESEFISEEAIMEIEDIEMVRDIQMIEDGEKYYIDNVVIEPGEMVIFNTGADLQNGEKTVLYGNLSGENVCYSVGYIYEGNYNEITGNIELAEVSETIISNETGKYYWCVMNVSNTTVKFDGNVQTETRNLLHKSFGEDVVVVDGACTLIVNYHGNEILEEIYVYDHQTQKENKVGYGADVIYKVSVPGAYTVYAITKEGGIINLKDYLTIEYEAGNTSGIISL